MEETATRMVETGSRIGQLEAKHRHRAQCKDGCRAARSNLDGPVADVVKKPDSPGASSVDMTDRQEGVGKV